MALSSYVGSFAQPGSTGNQAVTGVGFQPTLVLFWMTGATADGTAANVQLGMGAAVSSSDRRYFSHYSADAITPSVGGTGNRSDNANAIGCVSASAGTVTILAAADFVSMDSGGFTVNWTTVDATARIINYLALGGASLTNVKTGQLTNPTATGTQATTGVGFQPDVLLFFALGANTTTPVTVGSDLHGLIGFADSAGNVGSLSPFPSRANTTSNDKVYQRTASCVTMLNTAGAVVREASLTSMDSDGFTLNWSSTNSIQVYCFYVALKGISIKVGSFNQATSNGNQSVSNLGFAPSALMLESFDNAAATTVQTDYKLSLGITDGTRRASIWQGGLAGQTTTREKQDLDRANLLKMFTPASSPTTLTVADIATLDSDGFTINNTTTDATARQILYFAVGPGGQPMMRRWGGVPHMPDSNPFKAGRTW